MLGIPAINIPTINQNKKNLSNSKQNQSYGIQIVSKKYSDYYLINCCKNLIANKLLKCINNKIN